MNGDVSGFEAGWPGLWFLSFCSSLCVFAADAAWAGLEEAPCGGIETAVALWANDVAAASASITAVRDDLIIFDSVS